MTRTVGWINDGRDGREGLTASSTSFKHSPKWPSLPANAPQCLRDINIVVTDPERVLLVTEAKRRRDFQLLVKRLILQLRYGCQHPSCRTPTCFTFRSRVSPAPLRRLTSLSARTMACYLATQGNAEDLLCPYRSYAGLGTAETRPKSELDLAARQAENNTLEAAFVRNDKPEQRHSDPHSSLKPVKIQPEVAVNRSKAAVEGIHGENEGKTGPENKPVRKDPKSFTQNLFDTWPLKMLEWLPGTGNARVPTHQGGQAHDGTGSSQLISQSLSEKHHHRPPNTKSVLKGTAVPANPSATDHRRDMIASVHWSQNPSLESADARAGILNPIRVIKKSNSMDLLYDQRQSVAHAVLKRRRCSSAPIATCSLPSISHSQVLHPEASTDVLATKPYSKGVRDQKRTRLLASQTLGASKANQIAKPSVSPFTDQVPAFIESAAYHPSQSFFHDGAEIQSDQDTDHDLDLVKPPQSLSHFSYEAVDALYALLASADGVSTEERRLRSYFERHWTETYKIPQGLTTLRLQEVQSYFEQSIYYILSNPDALLDSFGTEERWQKTEFFNSHLVHRAFQLLLEDRSALVFQSLWQGVGVLFAPPPDLLPRRSSKSKASMASSTPRRSQLCKGKALNPGRNQQRYLDDLEACHIVLLGFHALVAAVPSTMNMIGDYLGHLRGLGNVGPDYPNIAPAQRRPFGDLMRCVEVFEDEMGLRLACRLIRGLATRLYFADVLKDKVVKGGRASADEKQWSLMEIICANLGSSPSYGLSTQWEHLEQSGPDDRRSPWRGPAVIVEWIRTVMIKSWDGREEVSRFGVVGSSITILRNFFERRHWLGLNPECFYVPHFANLLDPIDVATGWLSASEGGKSLHLLANPFLFTPDALVTYFRALNFSIMSRAFETAVTTMRQTFTLAVLDPDDGNRSLAARLNIAVTTYLILEIRRDRVLADAFDQLWRREKRELLRPLKVRMGMYEGEEGVDLGGVQQEFFRLAIGEALNPDFGLFTTDPETRMSWFQPLSAEPLYRFELVGLLVGLAIYNGATLPVTFPRALYRKLLGVQNTEIYHIQDGWPTLAKGLADLLNWNEGDVKDVFVRTYEFSFDLWGRRINIDMEQIGKDEDWPGGRTMESMKQSEGNSRSHPAMIKDKALEERITSQNGGSNGRPFDGTGRSTGVEVEAELVTNENREQYVKDYIFWLTDKSIRPQFEAFSKGFFACIDKRALSIFQNGLLQIVAEGSQDVDTAALEKAARYEDGYSRHHPLIRSFWDVVHEFSPSRKRQLLEFVTACDRVPVSGINGVLFVVQRSGPDSDRLPTSLTCFGRLLLPEYSSKRKLRQKLRLALENARGFGVP